MLSHNIISDKGSARARVRESVCYTCVMGLGAGVARRRCRVSPGQALSSLSLAYNMLMSGGNLIAHS